MSWSDWLFGASKASSTGPVTRTEHLAAQLEALDVYDLPAVVAGRSLIATTAATMQLVDHDGLRVSDYQPAILRRPDPSEPYRQTIERIAMAMSSRYGMSWLRCTTRTGAGFWWSLEVIDPQRVSYQTDPAGSEVIAVWIDGAEQDLRDVRWIPGLLDGTVRGTSPLAEVDAALEMLVAVYRFSSEYYGAGAVPPYAIKRKTRMTGTGPDELAQAWLRARQAHRPAVLTGPDIELETYTPTSAADALLTDAMHYLDAVVARVLQCPPSLLNTQSQGALTYSTTAGELARWLQLGLYPGTLARIESVFTDFLPRGHSARFDTSNLVRMDLSQRVETMAQSVAAGIHTPEEARAVVGLPADPISDPQPIDPTVEAIG